MEKTKKKKGHTGKKNQEEESNDVSPEQEKLRKKVTDLIKKQKLPAARQIVKGYDDSRPWNQEIRAKVCILNSPSHFSFHKTNCLVWEIKSVFNRMQVGGRLIELLIQTAFIQPPSDQLGDVPPEIRPAFVHTFKNLTQEK